jgi:hypothetical protein
MSHLTQSCHVEGNPVYAIALKEGLMKNVDKLAQEQVSFVEM